MTLTYHDEERVRQIVKEEVHEQLTDFRSDMDSRLDAILKVTTDTQQELVVLAHTSVKHTDKLERHDKQIKRLNQAVFVT